MKLEMDIFDPNKDYSGGAVFYHMWFGRRTYLNDRDLWLYQDQLPGPGERYANGIYREG